MSRSSSVSALARGQNTVVAIAQTTGDGASEPAIVACMNFAGRRMHARPIRRSSNVRNRPSLASRREIGQRRAPPDATSRGRVASKSSELVKARLASAKKAESTGGFLGGRALGSLLRLAGHLLPHAEQFDENAHLGRRISGHDRRRHVVDAAGRVALRRSALRRQRR